MPKTNGMTIVDRAAAFLAKHKSGVTPTELNDHLNVGNYASKYVLYMRIAGYDVSTVKSGRTVVSYVYNGPGTSGKNPLEMAETVSAKPKANTAPAKTVKVPKATKSVVAKAAKATKTAVNKAAEKLASAPVIPNDKNSEPEVLIQSVDILDTDWDNIGGLDIKQIV
jgi:hypothetical protein